MPGPSSTVSDMTPKSRDGRVLAVYYSQSGQMRRILERVLAPLGAAGVEVVWAPLEPVPAYPFPWRVREFFDSFPETVAGIPCVLRAPAFDPDGQYDLVVLGWQPWFLSPSIPVASFLRSEARRVLAGRPVVTVIGARNMWLMAQEEVKRLVHAAGGALVGNIALVDRAPNLVSAVTILRWMLRGKKEPFLGFPEAGVGAADVDAASRFGPVLLSHLRSSSFAGAQGSLLALDAVQVSPPLLAIERRGIFIFRLWSRFILGRKRAPAGWARRVKVALFSVYLPLVLFLVSPLVFLLAALGARLHPARTEREVRYHSGVDLRPPDA